MQDTTVTKRPAPKQRPRKPSLVEQIYSDITSGFGELKRQSGTAVANIKQGVRRIKEFVRK